MMHMDSGLWWTVALSVVVTIVFTLPLLPALLELWWPDDAKPLRVVREHDSNVANFAHGFERFVETKFAQGLASLGPTEIRHVALEAGGRCVLLGSSAAFSLEATQSDNLTVQNLLVGAGNVHLPDHVLYEAEVFAAANFSSGSLSAFRAVLAKGNAVLGSESVVLRWIHAHGVLTVGRSTQLYGRASADQGMELSGGVTFERLHAPKIAFGAPPHGAAIPIDVPPVRQPFFAGTKLDEFGKVWQVSQAIALPAASICEGALVVQGDVQVGAHSCLQQSLKSNGDIVFEAHCRADAAVVATGSIDIGQGCQVQGPVISELQVLVRRGCCVGTAASPTTISAPRIVIEEGSLVFGSVWAREQGEVKVVESGVMA